VALVNKLAKKKMQKKYFLQKKKGGKEERTIDSLVLSLFHALKVDQLTNLVDVMP
jgi:tRNA splicing endonuclease